MILGKIVGKVSTTKFDFLVTGEAKKFEYVQVLHKDCGYVLNQIIELERDADKSIAKCNVIGYKNKDGRIVRLRTPYAPGTEVLTAEDNFIRDIIQIDTKGAFIGFLEGKEIEVYLDLNKLLSRPVSILAKTGSGKSYLSAVLIEEIIEKNVPLLVIDPHGEYSSMKFPNDDEKDCLLMRGFGIKPKGYSREIIEFGDVNNALTPIRLNECLSKQEFIHLLPIKLNNAQLTLLYSVIKDIEIITFDNLMYELECINHPQKWNLINVIDYLKSLNLFSSSYTDYNELIQPGKCSIVNLKGLNPDAQQIIVYKLLKDLFGERKKNKIPPFFTIIEEAHLFSPEKGYSESKSSQVLRVIALEGRKFGLGLCFITQRSAHIDKTVLSQCATQFILKITNPNDLRAVSHSVEGITNDVEGEIKNLPIGTALVTGILDMPLFVKIRPRKSKHGGETTKLVQEENDIIGDVRGYERKEILPVIKPKISIQDIKIMMGVKEIETYLIPAALFSCKRDNNEFSLLIDLIKSDIVKDIDKAESCPLEGIKDAMKYAFYNRIDYRDIKYTKKFESRLKPEEIKRRLESFVKVLGYRECWIVHYKAVENDTNKYAS